MNQFYLNNIVGAPSSLAEGSTALLNVAMALGELVADKSLNVLDKIVMDEDPQTITFGDFYLSQLVDSIPKGDEKDRAYIMLRGLYPMQEYLEWNENAEPIIEGEYKYDEKDASNLAVAKSHDAIILSIAFRDAFKKDTLTLTSTAEPKGKFPEIVVENLYGAADNTAYIRGILQEREGISVDLFDEIRGYGNIHPTVERVFCKLTPDIQGSIINGFKEAIKQGLLIPNAGAGNACIIPNEELVRYEPYTDTEKIYELAIYHPLALRVFMAQSNGELYILDIKSKKELGDGGATQNAALRAAEKRFKKMKSAS